MKKTLTTLLLAGAIGLAGCNKCNENHSMDNEPAEPTKFYGFRAYGEVDNINQGSFRDITQIRIADLDGDGDLDLVVGTDTSRIILYENKIPQKGQ